MVLMVQRSQAEQLFKAAQDLEESLQQSLIWIGPTSVTGLDEKLPPGYLGLASESFNVESSEFAELHTRWNGRMARNDSYSSSLAGAQKTLATWPYVGFAYDAVLALARALDILARESHDIFNTSLVKQTLASRVSFAGAASHVDFTQDLEPSKADYLISNMREDSKTVVAIAQWKDRTIQQVVQEGLSHDAWLRDAISWPSEARNLPKVVCKYDCEPGSEWVSSAGACSKCAAGKYEVVDKCELCPVGTYAPLQGMITCLPCSYGYADRPGQTECNRCPENSKSTSASARDSVTDCVCFTGFYRLVEGSPCVECETGMQCADPTLWVERGFWHGQETPCLRGNDGVLYLPPEGNCGQTECKCSKPATSTLPAPGSFSEISGAVVHRCPRRSACNPKIPGSQDNSSALSRRAASVNLSSATEILPNICREGHAGIVCATCQPGYVMGFGGMCRSCSEGQHQLSNLFIFIAVLAAFLGWYQVWAPLLEPEDFSWTRHIYACLENFRARRRGQPKTEKGAGGAVLDARLADDERHLSARRQQYIRGALKIIFGFLQIVGSFNSWLRVEWPPALDWLFNEVAAPLQLVNVDTLPGFDCWIGDMRFPDKYKMTVLIPLAVLMLLTLPYLFCMFLGSTLYGGWMNHPRYKAVATRRTVTILLLIFIIYPALSSAILQGLHCKDYGLDGKYLFPDHRVDCSLESPEYMAMYPWTIVGVLIYPIGIPLVMLYVMYYQEIPRMAQQKRGEARFNSLLHLRKSQVCMPKEPCQVCNRDL